jgi:hypothetical protein
MNKSIQSEIERQKLIKRAHSLIFEIASRPNAQRLLRSVISMLESYISFKGNRTRIESK